MTDIENYHNWLRDAHAMEKQAESLLVATIRRLDNEPQLRTRLEQHLYETRRQLSALQDIIARNHISRSALKDAMSRVAALGQTIGIMLPGDEVIKVIITAYVFAHFEVACYTALLTAAKRVGDHSAMHTLEGILAEERGMADWLLHYLPALTGQYLMDTDMPGVVVKFFWTRRSDGRVMHRRATGRQGWPAFRTVRVIGSQVLNAIGYCYKS